MDKVLCCILLPLPRAAVAAFLWYVGVEYVCVTRDFAILLFKRVVLHYVSSIEKQLFDNLQAHSKREWIRRTQVVQERSGYLWRVALSWPGEVLKLLGVIGLTFLAHKLSGRVETLRELCGRCAADCSLQC